jgi:hypothetical protein
LNFKKVKLQENKDQRNKEEEKGKRNEIGWKLGARKQGVIKTKQVIGKNMERTSFEMDNNRDLDAIKSGGKVGKGKNITVELLLESKIKEIKDERLKKETDEEGVRIIHNQEILGSGRKIRRLMEKN